MYDWETFITFQVYFFKKMAVISVDGLVPAYYFAFIPTE